MSHAKHPVLALLTGFALWAPTGAAQTEDTPPPETQTEGEEQDRPDTVLNPLLTDTSADEQMRNRLSRPGGGISIPPAQSPSTKQVVPHQPADPARYDLVDGSAAWAPDNTLRPEGTFLVGWTGEVVQLRTGGLAFLPAAQAGSNPAISTPEPAMALLPCATYARIVSLLGEKDRGLWLSITGEVLEYHGRNFLLPTAFAHAQPPEEPVFPNEPYENSQTEDAPAGKPSAGGDRIDDLVRDLEAQRTERRGIDTTFAAQPADQAQTPQPSPRLDGKLLLRQRGRMVRSAEGGWVIAIDNDGGPDEGAPPHHLRLLPCRVVAQMEQQAENLGESWTFEVSGRLYRLGSTVYLLPRMFVTDGKNDVKPMQ